jgi:hypothetical protein
VERIDLRRMPHVERQRWRNGGEWDRFATKIAIGQLGDRWYVRWYDMTGDWAPPACVYGGPKAERYARATSRRWMRTFGGTWVEA